jgi:hypothetical protein
MMTDRLCEACGSALVAEHWPWDGNPQEIARTILDAATALVGSDICDRLRAWLPN